MSLKDTGTGYGWVSIALHWVSGVAIIYLLYLGNTIGSLEGDERAAALLRHTSIAISFYLIFVVRIAWRLCYGHPRPTAAQQGWAFAVGKWTHMTMIFALALMLISGPLMHWSYGNRIGVFVWFSIPGPIGQSPVLGGFMHSVHVFGALILFTGFLLHIAGVYKHTAFNHDGTLAKMIFADTQSSEDHTGESVTEQGGPLNE